ncbi:MAG: hypothetical protein U9P38_04215 [Campylobacterota bacterium]|nr:hypothetical protein [Campylobacterota bacterium]
MKLVWLKKLKIALAEKDMDKLDKLMDDIPSYTQQEDIMQALFLLREATTLVKELKEETSLSMSKMQKHIQFLKSTEAPKSFKRLDIRL